jgi:hypothetical protein
LLSFVSEEEPGSDAASAARAHGFIWEHAPERRSIAAAAIEPPPVAPVTTVTNTVAALVHPLRIRRKWWPPIQARLVALMAACVWVARGLLQWLSIHTWNAIIAVIGFVCAVLIVSARLSVIVTRRSARYAGQGARALAMLTARLVAVVRASATQLGRPSLRACASAARGLLRRDVRFPAIAPRHYAYPAVFMSGVAVGVLAMVGRAPSDQAERFPATTSARTDGVLPSDIAALPAANPQASRVDNPVSTSGIEAAGQDAGGVVRVAAAPAPPVRNRPEAPVRAVSRAPAPAASTASIPGRSRPPARVAPAREAQDDTPSPGAFRGSVAVGSSPVGAEVFVNGMPVGRTPLVLTDLPIGSRAVRVTLDGHQPWSRAVQVVANQRTTVTATLERSGSE